MLAKPRNHLMAYVNAEYTLSGSAEAKVPTATEGFLGQPLSDVVAFGQLERDSRFTVASGQPAPRVSPVSSLRPDSVSTATLRSTG